MIVNADLVIMVGEDTILLTDFFFSHRSGSVNQEDEDNMGGALRCYSQSYKMKVADDSEIMSCGVGNGLCLCSRWSPTDFLNMIIEYPGLYNFTFILLNAVRYQMDEWSTLSRI